MLERTFHTSGISVGFLISLLFGLIYVIGLHEPGAAYYLFAGLVFLGGPLIGGMVAARKSPGQKLKAFWQSSTITYGLACVLFIINYVVLVQFARTSVQLPTSCNGLEGALNPPAHLAYTLPDGSTGLLLTSDARSAVVVLIDETQPSFPSSVFLVDRSDNRTLLGLQFDNDVVSAALDEGIVYIFNDKLGYLFDTQTGEYEETFLIIDNYGGLSESDRPFFSRASSGYWYMETSAVISSWSLDGRVKSRPHLTFNGLARGCFIDGATEEITEL